MTDKKPEVKIVEFDDEKAERLLTISKMLVDFPLYSGIREATDRKIRKIEEDVEEKLKKVHEEEAKEKAEAETKAAAEKAKEIPPAASDSSPVHKGQPAPPLTGEEEHPKGGKK